MKKLDHCPLLSEFFLALSVLILLPTLVANNTQNYGLSKEAFDSCLFSPVSPFFIQGFPKTVSPKILSLCSGQICWLICKLCSFYHARIN